MPVNTVYDPETDNEVQKPVADGSHDDLGASPEQRTQETQDLDNLYRAESAPEKDPKTPADSKEEDKLDDQVGKGYTGKAGQDKEGKGSGSANKKKGVAALVSIMVAAGSMGMLGILQGPFQLVHASQLLQRFHFLSDEEFMDGRTGQLISYVRYRKQPHMRNLSMMGNKIANRYETKLRNAGIEIEYGSGRGRVSAIKFDMDNPKAVAALKEIEARGGKITGMADGVARVEAGTSAGRTGTRRGLLKGTVKGIGLSKVSSAVGSRTMTRRAGVDFHPLKNIVKTADEKLINYVKKVREDRNNRRKNGVNAPPDSGKTSGEYDVDDDEGRKRTPDGDTDLKSKLGKALGNASKALLAVAVLCFVQGLNDTIEESMQTLVVLPLIRTGTEIVAMGNQVMDGKDVNFDELGATATQFYDEVAEIGGKSFWSAASIQSELGEDVTGPDMPDAARPSGEKPAFFKAVDKVIDALPGPAGAAGAVIGAVCDVVGNPVANLAMDIITGLLTGGVLTAMLEVGVGMAQDRAVAYFADDLARWASSKPIAINAGGALLGNYTNFGMFLAGNENAIAHGAAALTGAQAQALRNEENAIQLARNKQKSPFDRYLNLYDADSLASKSLIQNPELASPTATVASLFRAPLSIFSGFGNLFSRTIAPSTFANNEPYDYGVPKYGFSSADADNELIDDPYENAEWVEERLSDLNNKYSKCFGTKIDPTTFKIQDTTNGEGVSYHHLKKNENDCGYGEKQNTSTEFLRYRVYLADQYAIKSMACYEGLDDEACEEIGFSPDGGVAGGSGGSSNGSAASDNNQPIKGNTASTQCAPGTTDLGEETEAYSDGKRYTIRLCSIPGFTSRSGEDSGVVRVNSTASSNWFNLYNAAKADGINLTANYSFRSMARQEYYYNCYQTKSCNNGAVAAKPGHSNHQMGLAVDIDINSAGKDPTLTSCQANPGRWPVYQWLATNASRFGMDAKVAGECWHWSPSGR